ncbi:XRE family transcriptional regulator [Bradyrhizobium sp. LTSP885]|uniref:helix-turn-helix domain-containing protein n=1 Tax=Bradyrhizobium sp. LTSP885 TaxID=1619232 RepID=UPI0005C91897|nr:XRE family transcriptional regulator [Bradyrhizobium sp. LTSP885]KJC43646.1 XRE family transcriptional regulator [Bradyrhizobium sp. LTSP885]
MQANLDQAIGSRLKELRMKSGLSLNELANRSGVSRGMIGRIERAESSATAMLLGKLCSALDTTLSAVVGLSDRPPERLTRKSEQPVWRDPETGYTRRHASARSAASGIEVIVVELQPETRVSYSPWGRRAYTQQLLLQQGQLNVFVGDKCFALSEGDCLDFDVMRPVSFENAGRTTAHYIVIVRNS